jgi:hypothetical protein
VESGGREEERYREGGMEGKRLTMALDQGFATGWFRGGFDKKIARSHICGNKLIYCHNCR